MKRVLAVLALAVLVAGCGPPSKKYVGKWVGTYDVPPGAADELKKMYEGDDLKHMIEEHYVSADLEMVLFSNMTFKMVVTTSHDREEFTGKWDFSDEAQTLTITRAEMTDWDRQVARQWGMSDMEYQTFQRNVRVFIPSEDKRTLTSTDLLRQVTITTTLKKQ